MAGLFTVVSPEVAVFSKNKSTSPSRENLSLAQRLQGIINERSESRAGTKAIQRVLSKRTDPLGRFAGSEAQRASLGEQLKVNRMRGEIDSLKRQYDQTPDRYAEAPGKLKQNIEGEGYTPLLPLYRTGTPEEFTRQRNYRGVSKLRG